MSDTATTAAATAVPPRLKVRYRDEIRPALRTDLGLPNVMMVPALEKVVLNMGVGEALQQPKLLEGATADLSLIPLWMLSGAMFPPGSGQPASAALPTVDSDQTGFKAAAEKAEGLAEKLGETAKGGDVKATLAAFAALGKEGCGGCHETFRKKQNPS